MARACGRLSSRPAPVGPPLAVVLVLVSPAFAWPKWLEPKRLRGGCPPARTSPLLGLGRGRWPDIGFPAYPRVLTPLSVRRVIRTAAVPRRWSWPTGSRYGFSANSACVCVRLVFTNKQKLTPFFLRHFGSNSMLAFVQCMLSAAIAYTQESGSSVLAGSFPKSIGAVSRQTATNYSVTRL